MLFFIKFWQILGEILSHINSGIEIILGIFLFMILNYYVFWGLSRTMVLLERVIDYLGVFLGFPTVVVHKILWIFYFFSIALVFPLWIVGIVTFEFVKKRNSNSFMGPIEKWQFFHFTNRGFLVAEKKRLSLDISMMSLLITGASGSGKSQRYILKNIISLTYSMVILDPDGTLYNDTSRTKTRQGFCVDVLSIDDPKKTTLKFNSLIAYKNNPNSLFKLASTLAKQQSNGNTDQFWTTMATSLLYIVFMAQCRNGDEKYMTFKNTALILDNWTSEETIEFMVFNLGKQLYDKEEEEYEDPSLSKELLAINEGFANKPEKLMQDILATAKASLVKLNDENLSQITSAHNFDVRLLREDNKTALYIIVSETNNAYYSEFLGLFFTFLYEELLKEEITQKTNPVFLLLEELGNIYIEGLHTYITVARRRKVATLGLIQSTSQFRENYGDTKAQNILENFATKIAMKGASYSDAKYISEQIGLKEDVDSGETPLVSAQDIQFMKSDQAILQNNMHPPVLLDNASHAYKYRKYKKIFDLPPMEHHYNPPVVSPLLPIFNLDDSQSNEKKKKEPKKNKLQG